MQALPSLSSNGYPIPQTVRYVGDLQETPASDLADGRARQTLLRDGYALLRSAVPAAALNQLRATYFAMFDGADDNGNEGHGLNGHPAHHIVRTPEFYLVADLPSLFAIASTLLGGPVKRLRRTPFRHFRPGTLTASRAHIDRTYLDCPTGDVVTIWVPLGDCPMTAGGLIYLENSHREPALIDRLRTTAPTDRAHDKRPLTHDLKWLADASGLRWLMTDYACGDVVAHTADIVHASVDPCGEWPRLSIDLRFVRADTPIDPRWKADWSADDGY